MRPAALSKAGAGESAHVASVSPLESHGLLMHASISVLVDVLVLVLVLVDVLVVVLVDVEVDVLVVVEVEVELELVLVLVDVELVVLPVGAAVGAAVGTVVDAVRHFRSDVGVGASDSYSSLSHAEEISVQYLSELGVGAMYSYSLSALHASRVVHAASDEEVPGTDSNSVASHVSHS